jgi:hypothetical protein
MDDKKLISIKLKGVQMWPPLVIDVETGKQIPGVKSIVISPIVPDQMVTATIEVSDFELDITTEAEIKKVKP